MIDATLKKKSRAHQRYRLADGTIVPGVTTILNVLAKPALIAWANRMGLQGIDTTKYVDAAALAGTACHAMIEAHLKHEVFDESEYDKDTLSIAANGFLKYLDWEKAHKVENVESELQLVSERYKFGGTVDMYATVDGSPTLIDFKTNASGIYDEMMHQVCAYRQLLVESGREVHQILIIRLGKSDQPDMETRYISEWDRHWNIFQHCLAIYNLTKKGA